MKRPATSGYPKTAGKSMAERDRLDKAYDKAHGIKQGSKKDMALDKKHGVYDYEYGPKAGKKGKK